MIEPLELMTILHRQRMATTYIPGIGWHAVGEDNERFLLGHSLFDITVESVSDLQHHFNWLQAEASECPVRACGRVEEERR